MTADSIACPGYRMNRRMFVGAAAGTFLGMNVKTLVARAGTEGKTTAEHVILFWNGGGMSHIDTFDPKPGREVQGEFDPIKTSVTGIQISEIFPELAKQMKHVALVRSIAGTNGDHGRATYQLQTSFAQSSNLQHPGIGSVVVSEKTALGDLPAYVTVGGLAPKAGYLGQRCEAYFVGRPGEKDPYLAFPASIGETRGNKRLDVLQRMNAKQAGHLPTGETEGAQTALTDAVRLMRSPALEAFEVRKEKPEVVEKYGDSEFGRSALLARRLVEKGVRFVQVNRGGFDTHSNNFPAMRDHGDAMDPALAALIEDLAQSGLLQKTMIVMLSEFGRTPKINMTKGRDHHPSVFTGLFAGGGIKGGQVIGSSDADGFGPKDRPVKVSDLHASICHALGINPNKEVMTPLQRPMKLVDNGKPVAELFS
ncbi:DUF1501 domain-containing protein [Fimbriiglobus ruber]|uniref:DUF1501 domain-containing protein n=1 Tax=Fimbriiglobus ruber TaxID=1908690 RepID=A0A225D296_9BACT|nr:DUF1501 domain-containing protein [Fimbriiglobus ruber]OWK35642.1 hypothetical protein FRUB_08205 [Fimbriiglobus ruber]